MRSAATGLSIAAVLVLCTMGMRAVTAAQAGAEVCRPAGERALLPGIPEASGVALGGDRSRLWVIRDSGAPVIFAVDQMGRPIEQVTIADARVTDWEDVTIGTCPAGRCLYIGDIGDNNRKRPQITVYRVAEPAQGTTSATAEAFHGVYPDGPHDAESLFLDADGRLNVVTKSRPSVIYRFPPSPAPASRSQLERVTPLAVGGSRASKKGGGGNAGEPATGAAVSPDDQWVGIRSNDALTFVRMKEIVAGAIQTPIHVDLTPLREPQGEALTFGADGAIYLVGEGGGRTGGTLTRITCTLPH